MALFHQRGTGSAYLTLIVCVLVCVSISKKVAQPTRLWNEDNIRSLLTSQAQPRVFLHNAGARIRTSHGLVSADESIGRRLLKATNRLSKLTARYHHQGGLPGSYQTVACIYLSVSDAWVSECHRLILFPVTLVAFNWDEFYSFAVFEEKLHNLWWSDVTHSTCGTD